LHGALPRLAEAVQPSHDDRLDGIRHVHLGEAFDQAVIAILPPEHAEIEQRLGHLLDE
jgi:hypothetical protein